MPAATSTQPPARIHIQYLQPTVDGGRYPAKRTVGDVVQVSCDVFRDGHDLLRAVIRALPPGGTWREYELHPVDAHIKGVRWAGSFPVDAMGRWELTVQAWTDQFATWRDELERKLAAGQESLAGELSEGVVLLEQAAARAEARGDQKLIEHALAILTDEDVPAAAKHDAALGPELYAAVER